MTFHHNLLRKAGHAAWESCSDRSRGWSLEMFGHCLL